MPVVSFPSGPSADFVEMEIATRAGDRFHLRLVVDSGFSGRSAFVLADKWQHVSWADVVPSQAAGALSGPQQRGWVHCSIRQLAWQRRLIAIFADINPLVLPDDADGIAGLSFLRNFDAWGAARTISGQWQFQLSLLDSPQRVV